MDDWKEVWERKGNSGSDDIRWMNGYEATQADADVIASAISEVLDLKGKRVLEVGCGAGYLARVMAPVCDYIGIDRSGSLVRNHRRILGNRVAMAEARYLPFCSDEFDCTFCHGVFHYFPNHAYAHAAVAEMLRVSRGSIFISDLPLRSWRDSHLLYDPAMFPGARITSGLYEPHSRNRFNVLIRQGR